MRCDGCERKVQAALKDVEGKANIIVFKCSEINYDLSKMAYMYVY